MSLDEKRYEVYEDIKSFYSKKPEYIKSLEKLDYYFSLIENMLEHTNNFLVIINSFKEVKKYDEITFENVEKIFYEMLDNTKTMTQLNLFDMLFNTKNTLYSIRKCVEVLNISDAMTLLRKLKDDLLLMTYFQKLSDSGEDVYNSIGKLKKYNDHVKNAFDWSRNSLRKFYHYQAINYLKEDEKINRLNDETKVLDGLYDVTKNLNNFAHSNGVSYITRFNPIHNIKQSIIFLNYMCYEIERIFSVIFTLFFYISPKYLSSADYELYMMAGETPPDNCQYIVASYLNDFINDKIEKFDKRLKEFLVNNTYMEIK